MTNVDRTLLEVTREFKREGFSVRVQAYRWGADRAEYAITHKTESPRWRLLVKACRTTAETQEYKDWAQATPEKVYYDDDGYKRETKESYEAVQRHYQRQPHTASGTSITLMFDKRRSRWSNGGMRMVAHWENVYDMPEDTVYDTPEGYRKAIGVGGTAKDVRAIRQQHAQAIRKRDTYVKNHAAELLEAVDALVLHTQVGDGPMLLDDVRVTTHPLAKSSFMTVPSLEFAALRLLAKHTGMLDGVQDQNKPSILNINLKGPDVIEVVEKDALDRESN